MDAINTFVKGEFMKSKTMKVVMVEPNKPAYITEIGKDLESLQSVV